MTHVINYLAFYILSIVIICLDIFFAYKSMVIYKKTKKILALFLSIIFILFLVGSHISLGTKKFTIKTLELNRKTLATQLAYSQKPHTKQETIDNQRTTRQQLNIDKRNLEKKYAISAFIEKAHIERFFFFLALFIMLTIFYRKLKMIDYKSPSPKILLIACSLFATLYMLYGISSAIKKPLHIFGIFNVLAPVTLFASIIFLGILTYKKSREIVYLYLAKAFILISYGATVIAFILFILFFIAWLFVTKTILSVPQMLNSVSVIIFPFLIYFYYLIHKTLRILESR